MKTYSLDFDEQEIANLSTVHELALEADRNKLPPGISKLQIAEVGLMFAQKALAARMAADKQPDLDMPPKVAD